MIHDCCKFKKGGTGKTTTIESFFKHPDQIINEEIEYSEESLLRKLIVFIARKNLSMRVGISDEMYDLLQYAFCSGSSHRNPLNLEASAKAFVHNYRQDFMTTKMIKIADEIDNQALSVYNNENLVYCTVAIDEGATKSRKLLYFCLEDPIICG